MEYLQGEKSKGLDDLNKTREKNRPHRCVGIAGRLAGRITAL